MILPAYGRLILRTKLEKDGKNQLLSDKLTL